MIKLGISVGLDSEMVDILKKCFYSKKTQDNIYKFIEFCEIFNELFNDVGFLEFKFEIQGNQFIHKNDSDEEKEKCFLKTNVTSTIFKSKENSKDIMYFSLYSKEDNAFGTSILRSVKDDLRYDILPNGDYRKFTELETRYLTFINDYDQIIKVRKRKNILKQIKK